MIDGSRISSQERGPRIGDAVTYISKVRGGEGYQQYPALVSGVCDNQDSPCAAVQLLVLGRPGTNPLAYVGQIQHRDAWAGGGGDDFGKYWCWPHEAEVGQRYTHPAVTGRPRAPDLSALGPAVPYLATDGQTPSVSPPSLLVDPPVYKSGPTDREAQLTARLWREMGRRLVKKRTQYPEGWDDLAIFVAVDRLVDRAGNLDELVKNSLYELEGPRSQARAALVAQISDAAADVANYVAMVLEKAENCPSRSAPRPAPEPAADAGFDAVPVTVQTAPERSVGDEVRDKLSELDGVEKRLRQLRSATARDRTLTEDLFDRKAPAEDVIAALSSLDGNEREVSVCVERVSALRSRLCELVPTLPPAATPQGDETGAGFRRLVALEVNLAESNLLLRSLGAVARRRGTETDWGVLQTRVAQMLSYQHQLMYPDSYAAPVRPADPHASLAPSETE